MTFSPRVGRFALTVHLTFATELITWFVIVPLSVAALLTGIVQSLGTTWGLFRHYWVVAKFAVTIVATGLLLVHTQAVGGYRLRGRSRSSSS